MDVTCERCGTEYEFDETLLSGRGTSVKCTNCGQVFKVYPTAGVDADRTTSVWRLKLEDESIDMIDSLRELQRRISSGELTPTNEIARGDENWKPLGSIPELETFFEAAGVKVSAAPAGLGTKSSAPPAETSKESSLPPGRRPRQPTLLGVMPAEKMTPDGATPAGLGSAHGFEARGETAAEPESRVENELSDGTGAKRASAPVSEPGSGGRMPAPSPYSSDSWADPAADTAQAPVVSRPPSPSAEVEEAEFEEQPLSMGRPSTPPPAYYDDDDDIPALPGRGSSPLRWLMLIVLVGGLALMFAQWPRVAQLLGIGGDPALIAASVADGDASLFEGHPVAYASAIEAYGHAIESGGDRDLEILSKLSHAYALAAQAQIDDGATPTSIDTLTTAARMTAESATELDARDLDARLAEADALRLTGDVPQARRALEEVRSMSFSRTAEFFRIDALLTAAEAGGDIEAALRSARQAVELAPDGIPYLLLLARAQRAAGEDTAAREQLATILADRPAHPTATKLLADLDAARAAPLPDAGVEVDAGSMADAGTGADPDPETGAEPETGTDPESGTESGTEKASPSPTPTPAPSRKPAYDEYDRLAKAAGSDDFVDGRPPVRGYDWYMQQGRAELAADNFARARAYFDSALEARPGSADAMDGLGDVMGELEDYISAARYFRVAAQRGHPDGYFNLGRTYERLGRNEEAVSAYYTYVKRRPSGAHVGAAVAAIKRLEPRAKLPAELEPDREPDPGPGAEPEPSAPDEPARESGTATP
ncbi:MAG: zinc-ribbon domain-containing protein [Myxococcales bacterium]|nr:zinc-ribbon domain-containing protein [Myxococcales bacterium]